MTPDHQTRTCRCGKKIPPHSPMGGPVHMCGADKAWASDNTPPECLNCGRKHRDECDDKRSQVKSGPAHAAVERYVAASILTASLLDGHANPTTSKRQSRLDKSRAPGPSDPTGSQALDQLERVDYAMHMWAHLYGPCLLCPVETDTHQPEERWLGQHTIIDPDLVDNLAARSVISRGTSRWIDALNRAQQHAADAAYRRWLTDFSGGAEADEMRRRMHELRRLASRMETVTRLLGWSGRVPGRSGMMDATGEDAA